MYEVIRPKPIAKPRPSYFAAVMELFIALALITLVGYLRNQSLLKPESQPLKSEAVAPTPSPAEPSYEFPDGGRELIPKFRFVALYGTPGDSGLGVLGAQPMAEAIARVKQLAAEHQPGVSEPIYPTLDIISTIAHAGPTEDGDYSRPVDTQRLTEWVAAAKVAGIYVVLDLQPGRTDFLTQAKTLETLLREPHVGLALDPEWRIGPNQVHLVQTGSVTANEVNQVSAWLASLVRDNKLPQKLFLLHQFKLKMLPDRAAIDTSSPELAFVFQMDGQGSQTAKQETWTNILRDPPANSYFGWKNFYKKDPIVLTPKATMQISPTPWFVSYQ